MVTVSLVLAPDHSAFNLPPLTWGADHLDLVARPGDFILKHQDELSILTWVAAPLLAFSTADFLTVLAMIVAMSVALYWQGAVFMACCSAAVRSLEPLHPKA